MPAFVRYVGIDYSGAKTPTDSLKGLRIYCGGNDGKPTEVFPPPSARRYWTRKGIAGWLVEILSEDVPTLVGIDHGFSFPLRYFENHGILPNWPTFLEDFQCHWPTDGDTIYVEFIRKGSLGNGGARMGNSRWRRLPARWTYREYFSTHAMLPIPAVSLVINNPNYCGRRSMINTPAVIVSVAMAIAHIR
jgi:hypothetical protein